MCRRGYNDISQSDFVQILWKFGDMLHLILSWYPLKIIEIHSAIVSEPRHSVTFCVEEYTVENRRVLIALHCAKHAHPMNEILDDNYQAEVDMLHPGTVVPHPTTIQQDIINIYVHMSTFVMNYFLVGVIIPSNIYFFGLKNIYRKSTVLFILCLMDGQVLLSRHTLDLSLFGMPMEKFTMQFWNLSGLSLICGNILF